MFKRYAAAAITAVAMFATAPTSEAATTTYRIVGTGDSILALATNIDILPPGGAVLTADTWINVEYGRQPYVAGMIGHSTSSIWPLVLSRSQPGGYIIIQDNGLGTSYDGWRNLMQRIVDETPNDRTLVFIPPVFHWWFNPKYHNDTTRYAEIMGEVAYTAGQQGQPYRIIPWRTAALNDMSLVCDSAAPPVRGAAMPPDVENHQPSRCDGQHPSQRGQLWLARALINITGGW
jgi:hypothetical protein